MMTIGFHTDAFNSSNWPFEKCLEWAKAHRLDHIECGVVDGVSFMQGLGYSPHLSLMDDPVLVRRNLEKYGVRFSQIDAAYPLSGEDGPVRGVPYVTKAIAWASHAGCPCVDTTDGLHRPEGLSDTEALDLMKRSYRQIIRVAEAHHVIVNIEPHGYFTTNPETMAEMLAFVDSPCLRMNMDTGNTFIAGRDPVAFLKRFLDKVSHVHIKDVSRELAEAVRGGQTGIAMSCCAIGEGVNAANIRECLRLLHNRGYSGTLSIECDGALIEQSLEWLRKTLAEIEVPQAASSPATAEMQPSSKPQKRKTR
ncbi:MAG: sugar phosphate isomerase/epimerase [Verrucomicrobia bacterium]|nr:sugar phosphate isomerase/epimerase [Verrucomicrobiota bacterium]